MDFNKNCASCKKTEWDKECCDSNNLIDESTEEGQISRIFIPSIKLSQNALVNNKGNIKKEDITLLSSMHRTSREKNHTINQSILNSSYIKNNIEQDQHNIDAIADILKQNTNFLLPPKRNKTRFRSTKKSDGKLNNIKNNSFKLAQEKLYYESTKKVKFSVNGLNLCELEGSKEFCVLSSAKKSKKPSIEKRKKRNRARTSNRNQLKGISKKAMKSDKKHIVIEESSMIIAQLTERKSSQQENGIKMFTFGDAE